MYSEWIRVVDCKSEKKSSVVKMVREKIGGEGQAMILPGEISSPSWSRSNRAPYNEPAVVARRTGVMGIGPAHHPFKHPAHTA